MLRKFCLTLAVVAALAISPATASATTTFSLPAAGDNILTVTTDQAVTNLILCEEYTGTDPEVSFGPLVFNVEVPAGTHTFELEPGSYILRSFENGSSLPLLNLSFAVTNVLPSPGPGSEMVPYVENVLGIDKGKAFGKAISIIARQGK